MAPSSPFVVAHRAGNDLGRLRRAEALGIRHVEADVRLFRGRLEVRHEKSLGPLPVFWDRGRLAGPRLARLAVGDVLAVLGRDTELLLDLKGIDRRLGARVLAALADADRERVAVCARNWTLLAPFRGAGVRVVHSARTRRELRRLLEARPPRRLDGVSVHASLLDARTVRELRGIAELVLAWPVAAAAAARSLGAWGVQGLITERLELVDELAVA